MNIRNTISHLALGVALVCSALVGSATAQVSPEEAIKKILEQVKTELTEIDRLLLESSRADAKVSMQAATEKLKQLMDSSKTSQGKVVRGIQQLIEELEKMAQNESQSGSGSGSPQDKPRDGEQPGEQQSSQRQNSDTPDMVDQGRKQGQKEGQKPGEQQQPEHQPGEQDKQSKAGGADPNDLGKNKTGKPIDDPTGRTDRRATQGNWGNLQGYERFIHSRGGLPETPSKYRRLHEAYQKRAQKSKK